MTPRNPGKPIRPLRRHARGQTAVLMTLVIGTLIGAMALGADVAVMYFNHLKLQKAVDAAALAGATYLQGGVQFTSSSPGCGSAGNSAQEAACTYAANNGLATSGNSLVINQPGTGLPPGAQTPNIQVFAQLTGLPYTFGRVLGLTTYSVAAGATATASNPTQSVQGLFPMAVQCNPPCNLNSLNPGSPVQFGDKFPMGASGNWQWLDSGSGSSGVGQAITGGMPGTYSIGGPITSETGNIGNSDPIISAFSILTSSCPTLSGDPCSGSNPDIIPSGDPCLVTVPAVNFGGCTGGCTTTIEGFANVYLEPSSTSTNITACFVQTVTPNSTAGASTAPQLGSYMQPQLIQ